MSCQHKYSKINKVCINKPCDDGLCVLHGKQKAKQKAKQKKKTHEVITDKKCMNINILLKDITYKFKYKNVEIHCIKTNEYDIWFGAMEVAKELNYKNVNQILKNKVDDEDKMKLENLININLTQKEKDAIYVNEYGLYCLIFGKKNEEINEFKKFITHDILPSMRRRNTVDTIILELINKYKKKEIKIKEGSVTLDNILHPFEDDKFICNDNDDILITINRKICFAEDAHNMYTYEYTKKSLYDNMKIKHYIKIGDICSICLEEIWSDRTAFLTDCGHGFHASCINKHFYMNKSARCPMCRSDTMDAELELKNKYNTGSYLDKLDDFWMNIDMMFPEKCYDFGYHHGYSNNYHDKGMNDDCEICLMYRIRGNEIYKKTR